MQEIELKFLIPTEQLSILTHDISIQYAKYSKLSAHYFDTSEQILAQSGMAVRIRQEDDKWVQTLKTQGDGIASRTEYNHSLDIDLVLQQQKAGNFLPDLSLYDDKPVSKTFQKLRKQGKLTFTDDLKTTVSNISCLYITDVNRTTCIISRNGTNTVNPSNNKDEIEVALDIGKVIHGVKQDLSLSIQEIEFELLSGNTEYLFEVAKIWCKQYKLCVSSVTKAERGSMLLAGKNQPHVVQAKLSDFVIDNNNTDVLTLNTLKTLNSKPPAQFIRSLVHQSILHIVPNATAIVSKSTDIAHYQQLNIALQRLISILEEFGSYDTSISCEWIFTLTKIASELNRDIHSLNSLLLSDTVTDNTFQLLLLELIQFSMSQVDTDTLNN